MTVRHAYLVFVLASIAAAPAASPPPNPITLATATKSTGTATCYAADGSSALGTWERVSSLGKTTEPSVLDAPAEATAPPDAMLYCRGAAGPGRIEAKPADLVYPPGTMVEPVYKVTILHPAADGQPPFDVALGPGGEISKAPFGEAIIFDRHSMLIVPATWKIARAAIAIEPTRPKTYSSTLDEGGCEVNRMDDEDEYPRYIGTSASDCSIKVDLNTLQ
ncbi:MAG TPA: hypothetical protein VMF11_00180 [Candidatus Baltobacteraceae bacterium]|nr:hypothetical protein [Candidatus Baltobacteraceae bacterium]